MLRPLAKFKTLPKLNKLTIPTLARFCNLHLISSFAHFLISGIFGIIWYYWHYLVQLLRYGVAKKHCYQPSQRLLRYFLWALWELFKRVK